jgi:prevent-host-death family protein
MSILVPISKARARLSELVRQSHDDDVVLLNHSTPAAVILSVDRYEAMLEEVEDLKDRLSIHERTGVTISAEKLAAELGLSI